MKKHITVEDLTQLTEAQKQRLFKLWQPSPMQACWLTEKEENHDNCETDDEYEDGNIIYMESIFNNSKIKTEKAEKEEISRDEKLTDFNLSKTKIMINKTHAISYKWIDSKGSKVAQFDIFDWWDGENIHNLEVFGKYKGKGLSYQLLDYATKKCGAKNLAVRKNNEIAKHVYDKYGFKVVSQDQNHYYMSLNS